jgi:predicted metal-binding membrane protein
MVVSIYRRKSMTDTAHDRQFDRVAPAAAGADGVLARSFDRLSGRPIVIALLGVVVLSGFGWIVLGVTAAGMSDGQIGGLLRDAICWPAVGQGTYFETTSEFGVVLTMWCAMVLAMMLPTAGPMMVTYAEIADTAARKGETIVSPMVLTAGYAAVWLGFALAATALQILLMYVALLAPTMRAASSWFAGAVFLAAGGYQFSSLKHACLTRCQRPFPFFFANWTDETKGVFRLGLRQGLYCLGCCWAMMLLMFAVGVMNVAWMAGLGVIMGMEKLSTTPRFSHAVGVTLVALGVAFIVVGSSA